MKKKPFYKRQLAEQAARMAERLAEQAANGGPKPQARPDGGELHVDVFQHPAGPDVVRIVVGDLALTLLPAQARELAGVMVRLADQIDERKPIIIVPAGGFSIALATEVIVRAKGNKSIRYFVEAREALDAAMDEYRGGALEIHLAQGLSDIGWHWKLAVSHKAVRMGRHFYLFCAGHAELTVPELLDATAWRAVDCDECLTRRASELVQARSTRCSICGEADAQSIEYEHCARCRDLPSSPKRKELGA